VSRLVEISPTHLAHASGALWIPATQTVIIADAHLGYGWALRRRGQLGPVVDEVARDKVRAVVDELQPATIVFLGDVVHAPRPDPREHELVGSTLRALSARARVVVVLGNHDRGFARDFPHLGIELVSRWEGDGLIGLHGDKPVGIDGGRLLVGHLHPALSVRDDAGASQRIPAFLVGASAYVLPAFSPFAAGFAVNVRLPAEVRALLGKGEVNVIAATGKRVVKLGPLSTLRKHTG
jgi:putative SbcD/Mre11-related phosphoesterase